MKICFTCKRVLKNRDFSSHPAQGLQSSCRECSGIAQRKREVGVNRAKYLYIRAKHRAKKRGLEFNIEIADIIIPKTCPVFGIPFELKGEYAPSLDRINPKLGYVKGNIQVMSLRANKIKFDCTYEEIYQVAMFMKNSGNGF